MLKFLKQLLIWIGVVVIVATIVIMVWDTIQLNQLVAVVNASKSDQASEAGNPLVWLLLAVAAGLVGGLLLGLGIGIPGRTFKQRVSDSQKATAQQVVNLNQVAQQPARTPMVHVADPTAQFGAVGVTPADATPPDATLPTGTPAGATRPDGPLAHAPLVDGTPAGGFSSTDEADLVGELAPADGAPTPDPATPTAPGSDPSQPTTVPTEPTAVINRAQDQSPAVAPNPPARLPHAAPPVPLASGLLQDQSSFATPHLTPTAPHPTSAPATPHMPSATGAYETPQARQPHTPEPLIDSSLSAELFRPMPAGVHRPRPDSTPVAPRPDSTPVAPRPDSTPVAPRPESAIPVPHLVEDSPSEAETIVQPTIAGTTPAWDNAIRTAGSGSAITPPAESH